MSYRPSSGYAAYPNGASSSSSSFGGALVSAAGGASSSLPSAAESSKQLTAASQLVERELDHDEKREEVLDELTSDKTGYYYFERNRLSLRRTVPIPQAIIDAYDQLECKSFVGLFPEVHRAFITIDNKLFLWNYYDGSDFYLYDELSQIIISVALLKPKPGVFVQSIQHILVVATPVEILMFAVKFDGDNVHNSLHLFPTQFTVPSDNVHMTSIIGTDQGRIFLCGRDGGIYELDYWSGAEDSSWFGSSSTATSTGSGVASALSAPFSNFFLANRKKCRKVNHSQSSFKLIRSILPTFLGGTAAPLTGGAADQQFESIVYDATRNFLYTLSSESNGRDGVKPVVSVYELGSDGWGMKLLSRNDTILQDARAVLRSLAVDTYSDLAPVSSGQKPVDLKLIHLAPLPVHESASIILMAITSHGHRFYFHLDRSRRLTVKFVRLCPPAITPEELHRGGGQHPNRVAKVEPRYAIGASPSLVHSAYYKDGCLLMADAGRSSLGDSLVSLHKNPRPPASASTSTNSKSWGAFQPKLEAQVLDETVESVHFESRIAEVGEVDQNQALNLLSSALYARATTNSNYSSRFTVTQASSRLAPSQRQPLYGLPELATQHLTPNRQLLVLTSSALQTFTKVRPLDELKHALSVKKRTNDESALVTLFQRYGAKEACAMCLILVGANYVTTSTSSNAGAGAEYDEVERKQSLNVSGLSQPGTMLSIASPNKLLGMGGSGGSGGGASSAALGGVSEDQLRKGAKQAFFRFGELAQESAAFHRGASSLTSESAKLQGVALYLSRWLRSHWEWSLCVSQPVESATGSTSATQQHQLAFRFGREFYQELLQPLVKLQRFLDDHQRLLVREDAQQLSSHMPAATPSTYGSTSASGLADPARLEVENFAALTALLNLTIEIFNLLLLFLTYSAPPTAIGSASSSSSSSLGASYLLRTSPFLTSGDLQFLRDTRFVDVLTTPEGQAVVRKMINTLAYIGAGSGMGSAATAQDSGMEVDHTGRSLTNKRGRRGDEYGDDGGLAVGSNTLIRQLHTVCPTFFGSSDLLYYNALDSLKLAKQHWNLAQDRAAHIQRALATYHSFIGSPAYPLEDIAAKLKGVYEYAGVVETAMRRAQLVERGEVKRPKFSGLATIGGGGQHQPHQQQLTDGEWIASQKKRCFDVILDTMNVLVFGTMAGKSLANGGGSAGAANGGGSSSSSGSDHRGISSTTVTVDSSIPPLSSSELAASRDRVVSLILSSQDAALHQALYCWYIEKDLLADLFSIQSPFLDRFLTSSEAYSGLLKEYYLKNERWREAALLLNFMSLKQGTEYNLQARMDFLTRALHCARNYQAQLQKNGADTSLTSSRGAAAGGGLKRNSAAAQAALHSSVAAQQDLIDQLKDRIEIARIQTEIYAQLQVLLEESYSDDELRRLEERSGMAGAGVGGGSGAGSHPDVTAFLEKRDQLGQSLLDLDSGLRDLQELYTFCTSFGLWEACLAIFKFSNESQRSDVICALWKNIFRAEMTRCKRRGQDWGASVRSKFVDLASDPSTLYRDVPFMFPLDFILRELEVNNARYRSEPEEDYVSETLLLAGIPPSQLLVTYDLLIENWDQQMATADVGGLASAQTVQTYIYWSIWYILRRVLDQERASVRRSTTSSSSAALFNKCLTNLRTLPPSDATTKLRTNFQELYAQFNRAQRR